MQSAQNPVRRAPVFDQFQRHLTQPEVPVLLREKLGFLAFHPVQAWTLYRQGKAGAGEPFFQRMKMYRQLANALDRNGKKQLNALLKQGVLSDQETDDQHSALYHLYSLYKTPRARGFGNKTLLAETVNLLHKPYLITQKFAPLSETTAQQLLQTRNYPSTLERSGLAPLPGSG